MKSSDFTLILFSVVYTLTIKVSDMLRLLFWAEICLKLDKMLSFIYTGIFLQYYTVTFNFVDHFIFTVNVTQYCIYTFNVVQYCVYTVNYVQYCCKIVVTTQCCIYKEKIVQC